MIFAPRAADEGTAAKAQFYVYDGWATGPSSRPVTTATS